MPDQKSTHERMPLALAALLGAFLMAGLAAGTLRSSGPVPAGGLPDLSDAQLVEIRDARGRTVLSGEFRARTDAGGNVEKDAALVDRRGRRVIGEVEIEIPGPAAATQAQELEIDIVELQRNAKHSIVIDDREVMVFTTDDRGSVDMEVQSAPPQDPPVQP